MMDQFLQLNPHVKLIVVDSVTAHFRQDFQDMAQRLHGSGRGTQPSSGLYESSDDKVLEDQNSRLVPALGESWGHAASTRVILYWQGSERYAYIYKSPSQPPAKALYLITSEGIRGERPQGRTRDGGGGEGEVDKRPRLEQQ
eukprot:gene27141-2372_t